MNSSLQDSAMLVALNISTWSARKFDRVATHEVDRQHGANGAGRFNKLLIDKAALEPIEQIEGAARQHHYSMTLPWGNQGERILPATLFMDYSHHMGNFKREFHARVRTFVTDYPDLMQQARSRLGTLYDPSDYPPAGEIAKRFGFETPVTPIPSADDFRVKLNDEYVEAIKADVRERQAQQQLEAVKHVYGRVREVVGRIRETCSKEKPRIFDSMIENAKQLVDILPALNLTSDPELNRLASEMKALCVHPDALRSSPSKRQDLAAAADRILATLPWQ